MRKTTKFLTILFGLLATSCINQTEVALNLTPRPNYTSQYIATNTGKATFEVPEVLELSQIALSLSSYPRSNRTTAYWREVETYFAPYRNHPLVAKLGSRVTNGSLEYLLRDGAFAMQFDASGKIVDGFYPFYYKNNPDIFLELLVDFQDFADKSNFRAFYRNQKATYDGMVATQERMMPVKNMWTWLEARFPARYQAYKTVFSPLLGSNHNTTQFGNEKDFREILMFVSLVSGANPTDPDAAIRVGLASRVVFTEIDHNYVNPVSDTRLAEINEAFKDRSKWATAGNANADSYTNAYLVFNEYITWAVFTLYAQDNFAPADFATINRITTDFMVGPRGFPKYREFNDKLLSYYQANRQAKAKDLFDQMLAWAKTQ
jgi:Domain of unknown function (DUF4932)